MQKIRIVAVGKLKESFWREAVAEYVKRLSRFAAVEVKELAERATIEEEAKEILAACRAGCGGGKAFQRRVCRACKETDGRGERDYVFNRLFVRAGGGGETGGGF